MLVKNYIHFKFGKSIDSPERSHVKVMSLQNLQEITLKYWICANDYKEKDYSYISLLFI